MANKENILTKCTTKVNPIDSSNGNDYISSFTGEWRIKQQTPHGSGEAGGREVLWLVMRRETHVLGGRDT